MALLLSLKLQVQVVLWAGYEIKEGISSVVQESYLCDHAYYEALLLNIVRLNGIRVGKDFACSAQRYQHQHPDLQRFWMERQLGDTDLNK